MPALGKVPALAVGHADVTALHHRLRSTPAMANRVVETLSRIYNAAEDRGRIPEASNPCRLVAKYRERRRERFLTAAELGRLRRVLDEAGTYGLGAFGERGVVTPYAGLGLSDAGDRAWRAGARWSLGSGFTMSLDGTRSEPANDNDPEHGIALRGTLRW